MRRCEDNVRASRGTELKEEERSKLDGEADRISSCTIRFLERHISEEKVFGLWRCFGATVIAYQLGC